MNAVTAIRRYFATRAGLEGRSPLGRQLDLLALGTLSVGGGDRAKIESNKLAAFGDAARALRGLSRVEMAVLRAKYWEHVQTIEVLRRHPDTGETVAYERRLYPSDERCAKWLGVRPDLYTALRKTAVQKVAAAVRGEYEIAG